MNPNGVEHAVILVAGRNTRLDTGKPKSLLEIGGRTLLLRHIRTFEQLGIRSICVVTGYKSETVEDYLSNQELKASIRTVHNDRFDLENGFSLSKVSDWVEEEGVDNFYLTMGDHIFEPEFVQKFAEQVNLARKLSLAVDIPSSNNEHIDLDDVTKVLVDDNGDIVHIGKGLVEYNRYDTGLFCLSVEVMPVLLECQEMGKNTISDMVNQLVAENDATTISIVGYQWNDIDNPDDLAASKSLGFS